MGNGPLYTYVMDTLQDEELTLWDLVLTDPEEFANLEDLAETWDDDGSWLSKVADKMLNSYRTKE